MKNYFYIILSVMSDKLWILLKGKFTILAFYFQKYNGRL